MTTKLKTLLLLIITFFQISFAGETDSTNVKSIDASFYLPKVHGVIRTRFEQQTSGDKTGRFQVANARVNLRGNVAPVASYFFQVDFCNKGEIKILDAYTSLHFTQKLKLMMGQTRIPFSVDGSRFIQDYLFTNHSFLGTYVGNFRGVGAKLGWNLQRIPIYIEGGIFNSAAIGRHEVWQKQYTYAVKSRYTLGDCFVEGAFESRCPDGIRINMWDAAFSWSTERWTFETEYVRKHYTNRAAASCNAFNIMTDYRMPIKTGWFNQLSYQLRFDGATDHSDGFRDNGALIVNQPDRKRLTAGVTISYLKDKIGCDLRANYEQYFYPRKHEHIAGDGNRISVELIAWF